MFRKKLAAAAALLLIMAVLCSCGAAPAQQQDAPQAQQHSGAGEDDADSGFRNLLDFAALTSDGGTFSQDDFSDYDVTVINIWDVSCSPCVREMPELAEFASSLPSNVNFITVCLSGASDRMTAILEEAGFKGTTLVSGDGDLAGLMDQIMYIPTTIFVDSNGRNVGNAFVGSPPYVTAHYTQAVNEALAEVGADPLS